MCNIKLKIKSEEFTGGLKAAMAQQINCDGKITPYFQSILSSKIGKVTLYRDWKEVDGYFYCEIEFPKKLVLTKLKKITKEYEPMRNCQVDVYMSTEEKEGYYQVMNGLTSIGFSIKKENSLYERLLKDLDLLSDQSDFFKTNITHKNKVSCERNFPGKPSYLNIYSFFVNGRGYDMLGLLNAVYGLSAPASH